MNPIQQWMLLGYIAWAAIVGGAGAMAVAAYWTWRCFFVLRSIDHSLKQMPGIKLALADERNTSQGFRRGFLAPEEVAPKR